MNPNTQPQNNSNQQPVIVKKVVKYKRKRSLVDFLIGTIILLLIIVVLGAFISLSAWLYTYKALTQEKVVAELRVGKKVIKDGIPTTRVVYTPLNQESAFFLGQQTTSEDIISKDIAGDEVFVDANFIRWENWVTLVGMRPVYKVYRVKGDFNNLSDRDAYRSGAFDINGGPDDFVVNFEKGQQNFRWAVQSAFISSAGINVTDQDQTFNVIVTKDAVVLEKK